MRAKTYYSKRAEQTLKKSLIDKMKFMQIHDNSDREEKKKEASFQNS